jgi:hypothetical protein
MVYRPKKFFSDDDFATAIKGSGGLVSIIAQKVGCSYNTALRYMRRNPELMELYSSEVEGVLDMSEQTIIRAIQSGDTGSAKGYLSRRGRHRGFGDQLEITTKDGRPIWQLSNEEILDELAQIGPGEDYEEKDPIDAEFKY